MSAYEELEKARQQWIKQDEPLIKESETPQLILRYKDSVSSVLEKRNPDSYFFVRDAGDRFGFSELLVNQLMKFAYERGIEAGKSQGSASGYDAAMKEVADKLGFER